MNLYDTIMKAKENTDYLTDLLGKFTPLLKKYAVLLNTEDGFFDLSELFIKTILKFPNDFNNT